MSIDFRASTLAVVVKLTYALVCFVFSGTLAAQVAEPDYRFEFTVRNSSPTDGVRTGTLQASVLPPQLHENSVNGDAPIPVVLTFDATLYSGRWLLEMDGEQPASEQERFVRGKFRLFQTAEQVGQYQQWLDPETYATFMESVARDEINLASDREFYLQFDDIRLLGSIRYGAYTLLYTQFRSKGSEEVTTSVMPVRHFEGRLVTAGSLHASSHELYRMLAFGTLQRQLMIYLNEQVSN